MSFRVGLRRSLPYAIAIISGFLLAYLIVAFFVFPSGVIPRDIQVPNVTGLAFDDAVRRLAERGLRGVKGEERFHGASPKNTVLEQSPSAGSRDVEGASITLTVSAGQQSTRVPSVNGMSRADAERALEQAGFDVGDVSERPSDTPAGQVIESNPQAGAETTIPSSVSLIVSAGPTVVLIPSVIGQTATQARLLLENAGLVVADVRTPDGQPVTDGNAIVVATTPASGAQVPAGSRVSIQANPPRQ
jgi:eukaryotic-like serine/threonine-protein kinase